MKKIYWAGLAFAAAAAGTVLIWQGHVVQSPAGSLPDQLPLRPDDKKVVEAGSGLYQQNCASCHGARLEGQPNWRTRLDNGRLPAPPHDETGHTWHHGEELLFRITRLGSAAVAGSDYETDMQGFADQMSDGEILAVLSYIKSTWPAYIRKQHDSISRSE